MKILGCCLLFFTAFSLHAAEPFYSAQVGTQVWLGEIRGSGERSDPSNVPSLSFAFEHGFPLLPNLSLRYTNLAERDLSYDALSYTLYYRLIEKPFIGLDTGITLSRFRNGEYLGVDDRTYEFDDNSVSFYTYGEIGLPYLPLMLFGQVNASNYGSRALEYQDLSLGLKWLVPIQAGDLSLHTGYRNSHLELNELSLRETVNDPQTIKISGWFVGVAMIF